MVELKVNTVQKRGIGEGAEATATEARWNDVTIDGDNDGGLNLAKEPLDGRLPLWTSGELTSQLEYSGE